MFIPKEVSAYTTVKIKKRTPEPCYDARVYFGVLAFLQWVCDEATLAQCDENDWDEDMVKRFANLELD
jgi:hypothetical protein